MKQSVGKMGNKTNFKLKLFFFKQKLRKKKVNLEKYRKEIISKKYLNAKNM